MVHGIRRFARLKTGDGSSGQVNPHDHFAKAMQQQQQLICLFTRSASVNDEKIGIGLKTASISGPK